MTAHILFTEIDPENCATLSPLILQGILREKLNFKGVLITDSLTMKGVLKGQKSLDEVVLKAFEAGNDILLVGGLDLANQVEGETNIDEMIRLYHSMLDAVRNGRISEKKVNESVTRILKLKEKAGLFETLPPTRQDLIETLQKEQHLNLAREIAYRSVQIQEWSLNDDLSLMNVMIIAPKMLERKLRETDFMTIGKSVTVHTFAGVKPSEDFCKKVLGQLDDTNYVIFCSYNAWKIPEQLELLRTVSNLKPTACIAVRDAHDLEASHHATVKMATYSPTSCSLQVAAEWLSGKTRPIVTSLEQAQDIGAKVWYNECLNRTDQLTFWNQNEPFPSMGIGHFIWPPKGYEGIFSRGRFHSVIAFMEKHDVDIPSWLLDARYSPWPSRDAFYQEFDSTKMKELRSFLEKTVPYQAMYMIERLNEAFREIVISTPQEMRQHVINQFFKVGRKQGGPYILVDYLNFKHEGTDPEERYLGQGWGLLQVLDGMKSAASPEEAFATSAITLLRQRISNSPHPEKEQQWLSGWINRLNTYY